MDLYYKTSSLRISTTSPLTEDEFNFKLKVNNITVKILQKHESLH